MAIDRRLLALLAGVTLVLLPLPAQSAAGAPEHAAVTPAAPPDAGGDDDQRPRPPAGRRGEQQPARADGEQPPASPCRPGTPPVAPPTTTYYGGNPLLGPSRAPTADPVGPLLAGYQRFGALARQDFLDQYANAAQDAYVYPPAGGFVVAPDGRPVKVAQTLLPGYRLDRFGFPGGGYLAPLGTPFGSRALPPSNLNTPEKAPLANYHVYCVLKAFTVDSGPTAPWFAQPGMGTQYKLERRHLPAAGAQLSVTWLIQHGYLVEEDLTATSGRRCDAATGVTTC
ncbi:glycohydrolase toxin TNT-related protein [Micromonospora sp. NPDC023956]|uniref:TNT domain-containing protein n=1 Tax=Micromonospora sp. NPDC023956 TaxID=3155722 RepID=UPI0033E39867